jgi:nicotinate-nucleotide pyrophosphorylase (carboxylating)
MVDTGNIADLSAVHDALSQRGMRDEVRLAFGGGAGLDDLVPVATAGADAVDVGRAILDAPLLDLRMRVRTA